MTIDDQIRDEKLQYDINREAAKISALSSNKIGKYEYLTGEEILPSIQKQIIEQAKFTYISTSIKAKVISTSLKAKAKVILIKAINFQQSHQHHTFRRKLNLLILL